MPKTLDEIRDAMDSLREKADKQKQNINDLQKEADQLLSVVGDLPLVGGYARAVKAGIDGAGYLAVSAIVALDMADDAIDALDPKQNPPPTTTPQS